MPWSHGDLFSEVESFILNKICNKEFSHEKLFLNASTSEKFKFENITEVVLNLIRDDIKETANLPEVKYLTSSLMEKLIVQHEEESGDLNTWPRTGDTCPPRSQEMEEAYCQSRIWGH